jgi:hypothetical protein
VKEIYNSVININKVKKSVENIESTYLQVNSFISNDNLVDLYEFSEKPDINKKREIGEFANSNFEIMSKLARLNITDINSAYVTINRNMEIYNELDQYYNSLKVYNKMDFMRIVTDYLDEDVMLSNNDVIQIYYNIFDCKYTYIANKNNIPINLRDIPKNKEGLYIKGLFPSIKADYLLMINNDDKRSFMLKSYFDTLIGITSKAWAYQSIITHVIETQKSLNLRREEHNFNIIDTYHGYSIIRFKTYSEKIKKLKIGQSLFFTPEKPNEKSYDCYLFKRKENGNLSLYFIQITRHLNRTVLLRKTFIEEA